MVNLSEVRGKFSRAKRRVRDTSEEHRRISEALSNADDAVSVEVEKLARMKARLKDSLIDRLRIGKIDGSTNETDRKTEMQENLVEQLTEIKSGLSHEITRKRVDMTSASIDAREVEGEMWREVTDALVDYLPDESREVIGKLYVAWRLSRGGTAPGSFDSFGKFLVGKIGLINMTPAEFNFFADELGSQFDINCNM